MWLVSHQSYEPEIICDYNYNRNNVFKFCINIFMLDILYGILYQFKFFLLFISLYQAEYFF